MEGCGGFGGVKRGLEQAGGGLVLGVRQGDEAGPERRDGAGAAADDQGLAIDADGVAGFGVSVAGDIRDAAAGEGAGEGDLGAGLPGGQWEDGADAAAGSAVIGGGVVPDSLRSDGVA